MAHTVRAVTYVNGYVVYIVNIVTYWNRCVAYVAEPADEPRA